MEKTNDQELLKEAEAYTAKGEALLLRGDPEKAEHQYLKALRIQALLLKRTGAQRFADAAAELAACLAECCMQEGNMHGADFYYAEILQYRQPRHS